MATGRGRTAAFSHRTESATGGSADRVRLSSLDSSFLRVETPNANLFRLTDGYCVTRIELISDRKAILSTIGFGPAPRPFASVVVNRLNIDL